MSRPNDIHTYFSSPYIISHATS